MQTITTRDHRPIVPVCLFHSIANDPQKLAYGHLSTSLESFESIARYLYKNHFNTITLTDLYNHLSTGEQIPPKPIVITLDDGYLDSWVNAFPILVKYGLKATIFVVPEFVDPQIEIRSTLRDVWEKKATLAEISVAGFLSWNEMKVMEASGLIDIQSHALTHTCFFQSSEIVDFHHPGDQYPWLAWNECPDRKHLWSREDQDEYVEFGAPIYAHGRALAAPQYFPDQSLEETLKDYVKQQGGRGFFKNPQWRARLYSVAKAYTEHNTLNARYESQIEYEQRVRRELSLSKQIIERALGKTVRFLCWPGGACNETTRRIAHKVGYLAATKGATKNTWGNDPRRIQRIGGEIALTRNHPRLDRFIRPTVFAAQVEAYRGSLFHDSMLSLSSRVLRAGRSLLRARRGGARIQGNNPDSLET